MLADVSVDIRMVYVAPGVSVVMSSRMEGAVQEEISNIIPHSQSTLAVL